MVGSFNFGSDRSFLISAFLALVLCSVLVLLVQRGTVGRYLAAMRGSPTAAATMGINLKTARLTVFAMSAGIAGFGGALYASVLTNVNATTFDYVYSLVFVVVVITTGSRTVEGAIQAGMAYSVFALILTLYLPTRFAGIEPILFAFGAMTYAAHPEGIVGVPEEQVDGAREQAVRRLRPAARPQVGATCRPVRRRGGRVEAVPAVSVPSVKGFRG